MSAVMRYLAALRNATNATWSRRSFAFPKDLLARAALREGEHVLDVACVTRFPSAEAMIRIMMAGTPLSTAMENSDPRLLRTIIDEVTMKLSEYIDDEGLAPPMQGWAVSARA